VTVRNFLKIFFASVLVVAVVFSFGSSKSSREGWLGVYGQSVDEELAKAFDLTVDHGAIVNRVLDDSPAEEIGLEEGDIIVSAAGARVRDYDDLVDIIEDHKPGDKIALKVIRDDDELEFEVTLESKPRRVSSGSYWYSDDNFIVPSVPKVPRVPSVPRVPDIGNFYIGGSSDSYIGVRLTELTKQLGEYFGVEKGRGVLITEVDKDSPAEKAGLKAGDVIVDIDGDKVYEYEDVRDVIGDTDEGDTVAITVMRDRSEKKFDVEVAEREGSFRWRPNIFAEPDIDYHIPDMKGLHYGIFSDGLYEEFDAEEFSEEMEEMMEELEDLQEELEEMKLENRDEWKEQMEEIREELQDLRDKLD